MEKNWNVIKYRSFIDFCCREFIGEAAMNITKYHQKLHFVIWYLEIWWYQKKCDICDMAIWYDNITAPLVMSSKILLPPLCALMIIALFHRATNSLSGMIIHPWVCIIGLGLQPCVIIDTLGWLIIPDRLWWPVD